MAHMATARGVRERVREQLVTEIKDVARHHLSETGPASLSMRAVARDLEMVSSAVYRYFPSRDALLTALIIDAYEGVAVAAETAEGNRARDDHRGRWRAVFHGVREWALEHPQEYALIQGSPVPGYAAPQETTVSAARVPHLLALIVADAWRADALTPHESEPDAGLSNDARGTIAELRGLASDGDVALAPLEDLPESALSVLDAWTQLYGTVSFELFGHYKGVIAAREAYLDRVADRTATMTGLPPSP